MKKFGIKEVVATGIGTALFIVLTEVQIPLTFCTFSGKVFLHQFNNDTGKQKYCDQVRNCHESDRKSVV